MASPVKKFELRQVVSEAVEEKPSSLTGKLQTFELQQKEKFEALEATTVEGHVRVQQKMLQAE